MVDPALPDLTKIPKVRPSRHGSGAQASFWESIGSWMSVTFSLFSLLLAA
jgi:hypothetical protein